MSGLGSSSGGGAGDGKPGPSAFLFDNEKSIQLEVPSITKLLDRKKLERSSPAQKATIRPKGGAERRTVVRLQTLAEDASSPPRPQSSEDLARRLRQAVSAGWVVVLASESGSFRAHAVLGGDRALWNLFTGFALGSQHAPATFETLKNARYVELTALSGAADAQSLRSALALPASSGLLLVAAGKGSAMPFLLLAAFPSSAGAFIEPRIAALLQPLAAATL